MGCECNKKNEIRMRPFPKQGTRLKVAGQGGQWMYQLVADRVQPFPLHMIARPSAHKHCFVGVT